jgi:hypothetical protein
MSNKTQLQTNNTALDGYIARINAAKEVAASLPEAGGGSIETSIVTINAPIECRYLGTDLQPKQEITSTFEAVKNSIAYINKPPVTGSGYTILVTSGSSMTGAAAVQLTDTTVNIIVSVGGGGAE